ncbi:response regulator [Belnapia sp. T18]|uniref:Response regulator n=1 Tax=Belnapia arida TaxID=2804533 RepID=A0ABS1UCH6_9PROT|nr:response regulator [Belnapia arida]MBL6081654.1 response regulator [Belnapia arida]
MNAEALPLALVVEDEALIALAMEDQLLDAGFQVAWASTEAEAVLMARDDLAVAIVNLCLAGDLAGQRVIASLRRRVPYLPVVVVTGYSAAAPEADLRGLGGPTVRLHKPEHHSQLAAAVRDVIYQANGGPMPQPKERRWTPRHSSCSERAKAAEVTPISPPSSRLGQPLS